VSETLEEAEPMTLVDLGPAAQQLASLLDGVADEALDAPTPCPDYRLGDLVEHVGGLALAFTAAARKATDDPASQRAPSGDGSQLPDDWRTRIPRDLDALAEAWRDPSAWTGTTQVGGGEFPGEQAGLFALDEIVLHGWDVARACGQEYDVDEASLEVLHGFLAEFSRPGQEAFRTGLFGPVVEVPADAPLLDRVIGMAGRDPAWSRPA
jgi:uncharacterized protein (TIGR03086 family)